MPHLSRDGIQLHYQSMGSGDAVLMLQGVGLPWCGWLPQLAPLAMKYRMIAPDNRGIGESGVTKELLTIEVMAADARAILDAEGIESVHVVGHSMGGIIAQQLALDIPDRVKSLSLLCTSGQARHLAKVTWDKIWRGMRMHIGTRRSRRRAFMEMVLTPTELAACDIDEKAAELAPIFGRDLADQPAITMRQIKALSLHDVLARLGEIQHIPSLVISGILDLVVPIEESRNLAKALNATHEEWEDACHGLPITLVDKTNERLLAHLEQSS